MHPLFRFSYNPIHETIQNLQIGRNPTVPTSRPKAHNLTSGIASTPPVIATAYWLIFRSLRQFGNAMNSKPLRTLNLVRGRFFRDKIAGRATDFRFSTVVLQLSMSPVFDMNDIYK